MTTPETPTTGPTPSRTLRTVLLIVGSIALAFVLLTTVVQVVSSVSRDDTSGVSMVGGNFDHVSVQSRAAHIDVRFDDVSQAELHFHQGASNQRLHHEVVGGELRIVIRPAGWNWWGVNFPFTESGDDARLEVVLPESLQQSSLDLTLESTAGDVTVDGKLGTIELESTAGNVRLRGSADDVTIETTAGDTRLIDYAVGGEFRSESTAGDSRLSFRTLPSGITVTSVAGELGVELPTGKYRIETDTTAGAVNSRVASDPTADRVYRFSTTAGGIDITQR